MEKYSECPFDPQIWGPHYWFFLMTIALSYPENVNAVVKRKYYDLIMNMPIFIPNSKPGNTFSNLLDKYPVSPYLDNRDSFVRWVIFIHNKVNIHLGKEEVSHNDALKRYFDNYKPKPIILSERMKLQKHIIVSIFILTCLWFIYVYWR
jgi:hypothetical protein